MRTSVDFDETDQWSLASVCDEELNRPRYNQSGVALEYQAYLLGVFRGR